MPKTAGAKRRMRAKEVFTLIRLRPHELIEALRLVVATVAVAGYPILPFTSHRYGPIVSGLYQSWTSRPFWMAGWISRSFSFSRN
jgi:hypothetical protein